MHMSERTLVLTICGRCLPVCSGVPNRASVQPILVDCPENILRQFYTSIIIHTHPVALTIVIVLYDVLSRASLYFK